MADMGHDAVTDVMTTLRGSIIGARIARKADLSEVIENALRNALLSLLEAGYWDFDKTVKSFADQGTPVSIMMVGVSYPEGVVSQQKHFAWERIYGVFESVFFPNTIRNLE